MEHILMLIGLGVVIWLGFRVASYGLSQLFDVWASRYTPAHIVHPYRGEDRFPTPTGFVKAAYTRRSSNNWDYVHFCLGRVPEKGSPNVIWIPKPEEIVIEHWIKHKDGTDELVSEERREFLEKDYQHTTALVPTVGAIALMSGDHGLGIRKVRVSCRKGEVVIVHVRSEELSMRVRVHTAYST